MHFRYVLHIRLDHMTHSEGHYGTEGLRNWRLRCAPESSIPHYGKHVTTAAKRSFLTSSTAKHTEPAARMMASCDDLIMIVSLSINIKPGKAGAFAAFDGLIQRSHAGEREASAADASRSESLQSSSIVSI